MAVKTIPAKYEFECDRCGSTVDAGTPSYNTATPDMPKDWTRVTHTYTEYKNGNAMQVYQPSYHFCKKCSNDFLKLLREKERNQPVEAAPMPERTEPEQ